MKSFAEIKRSAKSKINGKVMLLCFMLSFLMFVSELSPLIITGLTIGPLTVGGHRLVLKVIDEEQIGFKDIFYGYKVYVKSMLYYLINFAIAFLIAIVAICINVATEYLTPIAVLALLGVAFYVMLPMVLVPYILSDEEIAVIDAVKKAYLLMKGERYVLIGLCFSFVLWEILAVFTLGLLYIWLTPYMMITIGEWYRDLKERKLESIEATNDVA